MFRSLLIANRGEIACRIITTARRLGVRTIAVFSEADRCARHVRLADEAWPIGPAPAAESYLSVRAITAAVRTSGAEAVHPGYGFLAENARFATAVRRAGAVFVGPPTRAIRTMGSKSEAKALMEKAGVPVVPGYHGAEQGLAVFRRAAQAIGYPVLIKAAAGGGGRGMRIVSGPEGLAQALASAAREAAAAFGDDRLLLESYLARPRHIEVQVFADSLGNIVHLFERECSIQRRYQKVIEEAPAPGLGKHRRAAFCAAAVAAARAVGYEGAGTVEFITADDGAFYFMEMNTRLQVEHPVTEMITGQDLVEWQLRVAAGEPLPCGQDALVIRGHAIEARLYAEDPARGFLPSPGRLERLYLEPGDDGAVRIETGVEEGDLVTAHYDPMIAKLVAWGEDRGAAIRRMADALGAAEVAGVATNLDFLAAVIGHPAFVAGQLDTGFIDRHQAALLARPPAPPAAALVFACLRVLADQQRAAADAAAASSDPYSPWHRTDGWRAVGEGRQSLVFHHGEVRHAIEVHYRRGGGWRLVSASFDIEARLVEDKARTLVAFLDGVRRGARASRLGQHLTIGLDGVRHTLVLDDPFARSATLEAGAGHLAAPLPGRILAVLVRDGEQVARGTPLMVLEAMKMEHTITAPAAGTVGRIHYGAGEQVEEGAELLVVEPAGEG